MSTDTNKPSVTSTAPTKTATISPGPSVSKPTTTTLSPSGSKATAVKGPPPFKMTAPNTAVGKWLKLLCYARPGAGKTTLLGTSIDIEEMRDVLYIDAEKGYLAISENERIKNPDLLLENRVEVSDFKTVAQIHDFLKAHCHFRDTNNVDKLREQEAALRGCSPDEIIEPKRFRTVLIDSMTEVDIYCTYGLLGVTQDKVLRGESSDIDVARFDEFRKNNQMVQMLCRAFRDLPIHVLAAAHETYSEDEQRKKSYSPALTGQLKRQVPGFFDIVGYLTYKVEGEKIIRRMYVQPIGPFEAKNRRSVFKADFFADPKMIDIMKGCGLLKPELPKENAVATATA